MGRRAGGVPAGGLYAGGAKPCYTILLYPHLGRAGHALAVRFQRVVHRHAGHRPADDLRPAGQCGEHRPLHRPGLRLRRPPGARIQGRRLGHFHRPMDRLHLCRFRRLAPLRLLLQERFLRYARNDRLSSRRGRRPRKGSGAEQLAGVLRAEPRIRSGAAGGRSSC